MLQVPTLDLIDCHSKFCWECILDCVIPIRSGLEVLHQHLTTNFVFLLHESRVLSHGHEASPLLVSAVGGDWNFCRPASLLSPLVSASLADLWLRRIGDHRSLRFPNFRFNHRSSYIPCIFCARDSSENVVIDFITRQLLLTTEAVASHVGPGSCLHPSLAKSSRWLLGDKEVVLVYDVDGYADWLVRKLWEESI